MSTGESANSDDVKAFLDQLRRHENAFENLMVDFSSKRQRRQGEGSPWVDTNVSLDGVYWADGRSDNRRRLHARREVITWENGAADFSASSFDWSYDGKVSRHVKHTSGAWDRAMQPSRRVQVSSMPNPGILSSWYTQAAGPGFSIQFGKPPMSPQGTTRFSDYFGMFSRYDGFVMEQVAGERGERLCRICIGIPMQLEATYTFDLDRGCSWIGFQSRKPLRKGGARILNEMRVNQMVNPCEGCWFPAEAVREFPAHDCPAERERLVFSANCVEINSPSFDEGVFAAPIPEGYFVDDQITGKTYRSAR